MCDNCIEQFPHLDHQVIDAIHQNREAFIALTEKIRQDAGGKCFTITEMGTKIPDKPLVEAVMLSVYVTSFLAQSLHHKDQLEPLLQEVATAGLDDGHIYETVRTMRRN
jgi:hypothetical protein